MRSREGTVNLAVTRTGLTPASDDELTTKDHLHEVASSLLGARMTEVGNRWWGDTVWKVRPLPSIWVGGVWYARYNGEALGRG